jgi:hypothetical protein
MKNYTLGYTIPSQQKAGWINYGGGNFTPNLVSFEGDQDHSPPFPPNPPAKPQVGDAVYVLDMGRFGNAWQWSLNGQSIMEVDSPANAPLLYNPSCPTAIRPDLVIRTNKDSWVDLVFQAGAPPGPLLEINHVIHKHASRFWKIGTGAGVFNWTSIAEAAAAQPELFNFVNPNLRDTAVTLFVTIVQIQARSCCTATLRLIWQEVWRWLSWTELISGRKFPLNSRSTNTDFL